MPRVIYDDGWSWLPIKIFRWTIILHIRLRRGRYSYVDALRNAIHHDVISWRELLQNWGWIK